MTAPDDQADEQGGTGPRDEDLAPVVPIDFVTAVLQEVAGPDEAGSVLTVVPAHLPANVRERILAMGKPAAPSLVRLVRETTQHSGWHDLATTHAAGLLAELHATEAIEPMLGLYAVAPVGEDLHTALYHALQSFREAIVEPALRALEGHRDIEAQRTVAALLANLGVQDERIFEALVGRLYRDSGHGATSLKDYGDARAIPDLQVVLDVTDVPTSSDYIEGTEVHYLFDALEALGASLSPAQEWKLARLRKHQAPLKAEFLRRAREYLRRHDAADPGA